MSQYQDPSKIDLWRQEVTEAIHVEEQAHDDTKSACSPVTLPHASRTSMQPRPQTSHGDTLSFDPQLTPQSSPEKLPAEDGDDESAISDTAGVDEESSMFSHITDSSRTYIPSDVRSVSVEGEAAEDSRSDESLISEDWHMNGLHNELRVDEDRRIREAEDERKNKDEETERRAWNGKPKDFFGASWHLY